MNSHECHSTYESIINHTNTTNTNVKSITRRERERERDTEYAPLYNYTLQSLLVLFLYSILVNGTHDGRINCEHVCVRVGERNKKEKKSLVIKVKFKKSRTRINC